MMIRGTMLACVGALVVAGVGTGLSQATAPGSNGRIAFTRYELHDTPLTSHIVVANSDGSGQRTITHASRQYEDDQPDWSPNGSRILFERCINDQCHLWTMRPDGSQQRRLSPRCPANPSPPRCPDDTYPVYSPDGKQLVFVSKPRAFPAVFVVNADGSGLRRITPWNLRADNHPDWSPDGTRILFGAGRPDHGNLFTIRPDGTRLQQLTHFSGLTGMSTGSWSPDGKSIVFGTVVGAVNRPGATLNDLFVMNADGSHRRPITRTRNYDG